MSISTGKAARKRYGNRYDCKRHSRHTNPAKKARWQQMEKERKAKKGTYSLAEVR